VIKKNQTTPHFSQLLDDGSKRFAKGFDAAHHNRVASRKFRGCGFGGFPLLVFVLDHPPRS
jgi:hypothetical protein